MLENASEETTWGATMHRVSYKRWVAHNHCVFLQIDQQFKMRVTHGVSPQQLVDIGLISSGPY